MSIDAPDATWQAQADAAREAVRAREAQSGVDLGRSLLALGGVISIAFLTFVLGVAFGVRGDDVTMLALAAITFVIALSPIAIDQGRARSDRHTFISLVGLIFLAAYVIPIFTNYIPAEGPVNAPTMADTNLVPADLVVGQLVVLLALVVILAVYWMPVGRAIAQRLPHPRVEWPLPTILVVALIMMALGWPVPIAAYSGIIPKEWGTGVLGTLYRGTIYANVILMLAWIRWRSPFALVLMLVNVLLGGLNGLVIAAKTEMLIRPFIIAVTWIMVRRRLPLRWFVVGLLALMIIYPTVIFLRLLREEGWSPQQTITNPIQTLNTLGRHISETDSSVWLMTGLMATASRTDSIGVTTVLIRDTPSVSPFLYGGTLKLLPMAFVPRILWPGKPFIDTGQLTTSVYGSGPHVRSNTAPSQIGDYYINFGIPGVIFGMALLGLMVRVAHEALLWKGGTAASILILVVAVYYLTIAFEANVAIVYSQIVLSVVPVWLATLLARFMLPTYVRKLDEPPETQRPPATQAPQW